ncbi:MAG: hypothetical protein AAGF33_00010 [Pseudomonadota bacterium]
MPSVRRRDEVGLPKNMHIASVRDEFPRIRRGLVLLGAGLGMSAAAVSAEAQQRPFPVVAVQCDAELALCQALVQALSEMAPMYLYRINPSPLPSDAFALRLERPDDRHAYLSWQNGGAGAPVAWRSLTDTELAAQLVAASPDLPDALRGHP